MANASAKIAVIGTGYVGLVTGVCLSHLGHDVTCADPVQSKIDMLNAGEMPIHEPGLAEMVRECVDAGRLHFVTDSNDAVSTAEFVFLCVPTPSDTDGSVDLKYLQQASGEIARSLSSGTVVVNKSTVPVGSTRVVENILKRHDVSVVSNPEFLREGSAIHDFLNPDRVVIGSDDNAAAEKLAALYKPIAETILVTDPASAETIKYGANAYLAMKITYANTIANLCEEIGANVEDVLRGIGLDNRIGENSMHPGPGWGGSCFPKDTSALLAMADDVGYDFTLLRDIIAVNKLQRERVVEKIKRAVGGTLLGRTVGVWGLTFKAGTDDLRDSPAVEIVNMLRDRGAVIRAFDPTVTKAIDGIEVCENPYAVCEGAEVVAVLTEWPQFADLDLSKVHDIMKFPRIVDARNAISSEAARAAGFTYVGVGGV